MRLNLVVGAAVGSRFLFLVQGVAQAGTSPFEFQLLAGVGVVCSDFPDSEVKNVHGVLQVGVAPLAMTPLGLAALVGFAPLALTALELAAPLALTPLELAAPLVLAPLELAAPLALAPLKLAPLRFVPLALTPLELAPPRFAYLALAPFLLGDGCSHRRLAEAAAALLALTPLELAPPRFAQVAAPLALTPLELAPPRFAPLELAPCLLGDGCSQRRLTEAALCNRYCCPGYRQ
jgi:hypothetical protein